MRYKKADKDIKEIGQELGVATILEGSIQKENTRIRVSAQLINVEDNFQLWAQTYDRKLESVFDLQDDISKAIADALKIRLTEVETVELGRVPTESMDAYEYYLKGRSFFYTYEKPKNEQAISMFKEALDLDSSFSLAFAGLSLCYTQYKNTGWDEDEKWLNLAEDSAKKAIELDANSAEAHFALGFVLEQRKQYEAMEREMRQVLRLNPNHAHAHDSIGDKFNRAKGDIEEALREYSLALMIDPFLLPSYWGIADINIKQGKYREAKKILLQSLEIHENNDLSMIFLGRVHRFLGEYEKSVEVLKKAAMLNPSRILIHVDLGLTYVLMKRYNDALAEASLIANISDMPKEDNFSLLYLSGWISNAQDNWEASLKNFERALAIRSAFPKDKQPKWDIKVEDIRSAIAETYLRQKNFKAAIQEYSRMTDSPKGHQLIDEYVWARRHYKMAAAYEKMNDFSRAKKEYESFLRLWKDADPDIPEIIEAKKRLGAL
jgi:tetratricopeptide (TPR) repeat protein